MKSTAAPEKGGPRVNRDIRAVQVQLIDAEGTNRGVINLSDAQQLADESFRSSDRSLLEQWARTL